MKGTFTFENIRLTLIRDSIKQFHFSVCLNFFIFQFEETILLIEVKCLYELNISNFDGVVLEICY